MRRDSNSTGPKTRQEEIREDKKHLQPSSSKQMLPPAVLGSRPASGFLCQYHGPRSVLTEVPWGTFSSTEAGSFGIQLCGGEGSSMSMCHPWATEILSLVAMNSTSCSRLPGCLSTSPREVPAQAPAQAPQSEAKQSVY